MAIDFLGKEGEKLAKKEAIAIKMHNPEKQVVATSKQKEKPKVKPKKETPKIQSREKFEQVNLIFSFKQYILKRRLTFILIFVIIIAVLAVFVYWLLTRPKPISPPPPPIPVCGNEKIEAGEQCDSSGCITDQVCVDCQCQNIIISPPPPPAPVCGNGQIETGEQCDQIGCSTNQTCVNCQCQGVIAPPPPPPPPPPAPVCGNGQVETGEQCDLTGCTPEQTCLDCQCQIVILPDTELAPLRGALIKFSSDNNIYLIDYNGELRLVDPLTASFKNNQTIRDIKIDEIYLIADQYKTVRMGQPVLGKVDWDPRILSSAELIPFQ